MARFALGSLLQGQTRIAKLEGAYNLTLKVLQVGVVKLTGNHGLGCVRFGCGPALEVKRG